MRKVFLLTAVAIVLLLQPTPLGACSCGLGSFITKPSGPNQVVLVAKIDNVSGDATLNGHKAGYEAQATVLDFFWGPRARVLSSDNHIRLRGSHEICSDFFFLQGKSYFISGSADQDGVIKVGSCSGSGELDWDRSQLNLRALSYGPLGQTGAVLGKVSKTASPIRPVAHVGLVLEGSDGIAFRTTTDDEGIYLINGVPEGTYTIRLVAAKSQRQERKLFVNAGEYADGTLELHQDTTPRTVDHPRPK